MDAIIFKGIVCSLCFEYLVYYFRNLQKFLVSCRICYSNAYVFHKPRSFSGKTKLFSLRNMRIGIKEDGFLSQSFYCLDLLYTNVVVSILGSFPFELLE